MAGETVTVTTTTNSFTNAGTHTVTISGISNTTNYSYTAESKTLTINKRAVSIEWSNTSYTYDGNAHGATVSVKGVNGENVSYTLSTNSYTNAGTYTVSVASINNTNYTLTGAANVSTTLTISKKVIEFTWTVPDGTTETGSAKSYTVKANNLASGDTVNAQVTIKKNGTQVNEISGAGTYTITVTGLTGADANNYTLSGSTSSTRSCTIKAA